jgi:hypothetical protein
MYPDESNLEDETSFEFDLYEHMRLELTRVLREDGREAVEAERIAFYFVQGVREVPRLLNALTQRTLPDVRIRALLDAAVENAPLLEKARILLNTPERIKN